MTVPPEAPSSLVVLGSGAAGLAAAVHAGRLGLAPVVVEGHAPGGRLATAPDPSWFPGVAAGTDAAALTGRWRAQAEEAGAVFVAGAATEASLTARPFIVRTDDGVRAAEALIVATGTRPRRLGVPGEEPLLGYGVSTCATCDGFFCRDQDVLVVGAGDTGLEDALYLLRWARRVTVVHAGDEPTAIAALRRRALGDPRLAWRPRSRVVEILGEPGHGGVTGVVVAREDGAGEQRLDCQAVFVAAGREPASELFAGQLALDERGHVVTTGRGTATGVAGVFAAGEVADPIYRDVLAAAGSGVMAATDAWGFLMDARSAADVAREHAGAPS